MMSMVVQLQRVPLAAWTWETGWSRAGSRSIGPVTPKASTMAHNARQNAPGGEYGRAATWCPGYIALASIKVISRVVAQRVPNKYLRARENAISERLTSKSLK